MRKLLGSVDNGSDLNHIAPQAVDDPIVLEDKLPQVLSSVFRDDPSRKRKLAQLLDMSDDALDEQACVMGGVAGDKPAIESRSRRAEGDQLT
jgi:hypothetical protein